MEILDIAIRADRVNAACKANVCIFCIFVCMLSAMVAIIVWPCWEWSICQFKHFSNICNIIYIIISKQSFEEAMHPGTFHHVAAVRPHLLFVIAWLAFFANLSTFTIFSNIFFFCVLMGWEATTVHIFTSSFTFNRT